MSRSIGLFIFDEVEELDWVGPWEVFTSMGSVTGDRVVSIAATEGPIRCAKGLRALPDCTFENAPKRQALNCTFDELVETSWKSLRCRRSEAVMPPA